MIHQGNRAFWARVVAGAGAALLGGFALTACSSSGPSSPAVLLVGTYHGHAGQYDSVQAAVNVAQPGIGSWSLLATTTKRTMPASTSKTALSNGDHGGVVVNTSNLHIRGMNRSSVIVDGTNRARRRAAPTRRIRTLALSSTGRLKAATASSCGRRTTSASRT